MDTMERIKKAIKAGKFAWERYIDGGSYYGTMIATMPLYCSYGQIGFTVTNLESGEVLRYDWELKQISAE